MSLISDEFINKIILIQRNFGYKIINKLPYELQMKIWRYVYSYSVILITPLVRINWNYNKSENLKKLLAKSDDTGILQLEYNDFIKCDNEHYIINCNNCKYYRFPCLNCHYYVFPSIEPAMWKHPDEPNPQLKFRWGKEKALNHYQY